MTARKHTLKVSPRECQHIDPNGKTWCWTVHGGRDRKRFFLTHDCWWRTVGMNHPLVERTRKAKGALGYRYWRAFHIWFPYLLTAPMRRFTRTAINCEACGASVTCAEHGTYPVDFFEMDEKGSGRWCYFCGDCAGIYQTAFGAIIHECDDPLGIFGGDHEKGISGDGRINFPRGTRPPKKVELPGGFTVTVRS